MVAIGRDHSMSFQVGRGMERYESVDVVHFDAHPEFWDEIGGARFTHGNNLRRLSELPLVRTLAMIGITSISKQLHQEACHRGVNVVPAEKFKADGAAITIDEAVRPSRHIYVSIYIDVLAPSLQGYRMSGFVTPWQRSARRAASSASTSSS